MKSRAPPLWCSASSSHSQTWTHEPLSVVVVLGFEPRVGSQVERREDGNLPVKRSSQGYKNSIVSQEPSHGKVGVQHQSLGSGHEELNISPDRNLRRHSFAQLSTKLLSRRFSPKSIHHTRWKLLYYPVVPQVRSSIGQGFQLLIHQLQPLPLDASFVCLRHIVLLIDPSPARGGAGISELLTRGASSPYSPEALLLRRHLFEQPDQSMCLMR